MSRNLSQIGETFSFRFLDKELNQKLIAEIRRAGVRHEIDENGAVRYSVADEEPVEGDIIPSIQRAIFADWQVVCCPKDWASRYKEYIQNNHIPYFEEESDGELEFLVPGHLDPHSWKL